jgi:hypothetical protein
MFKSLAIFFLLSTGCAYADLKPSPSPVSMPEPSAIPELLVCVGAVGFIAWRLHKQKAS